MVFIKGKTVNLRPVELADVKLIARWINDPDATQFMFAGQLPLNERQVKQLVKGYTEDSRNVVFIAADIATNLPIGLAGIFELYSIPHHTGRFLPGFIASWYSTSGSGDYRILIGEKKFWNRGYGTEICALLTHYGFDRLNLNVISLGTTRADNRGAIRLYESLGYQFCGIRRRALYRNGRYYDAALMDILRGEYYKKFLKKYEKNFGVKSSANFPWGKNGDSELQKLVKVVRRRYYRK